MNLITFEGRTVAVMAPEDLDALEAERDTLKRQVEALVTRLSDINAPENYSGYMDDWRTLSPIEQNEMWATWSLEQAKKGGAG